MSYCANKNGVVKECHSWYSSCVNASSNEHYDTAQETRAQWVARIPADESARVIAYLCAKEDCNKQISFRASGYCSVTCYNNRGKSYGFTRKKLRLIQEHKNQFAKHDNAFSFRVFNGRVENSGNESVVYGQIGCGAKSLGEGSVYIGESMRGHAGRYFGYYGNSRDSLRKGTFVKLLLLESRDLELTLGRRRVIEHFAVKESKARGLRVATTSTSDNIFDLVPREEVEFLKNYAMKFVDALELNGVI